MSRLACSCPATGIGIVLTVVGSLWLFEPLPGVTLRPSWVLLAGIGGTVLAFVVGMPSTGADSVRHADRSAWSG